MTFFKAVQSETNNSKTNSAAKSNSCSSKRRDKTYNLSLPYCNSQHVPQIYIQSFSFQTAKSNAGYHKSLRLFHASKIKENTADSIASPNKYCWTKTIYEH